MSVLPSMHSVLNSRDLPVTVQGRQAGALEVDGLPNEPDCLVHFRASVGGLPALSNPSVNNSSTERQLMGF